MWELQPTSFVGWDASETQSRDYREKSQRKDESLCQATNLRAGCRLRVSVCVLCRYPSDLVQDGM